MSEWPTVLLITTLAVISPGADFAIVTRTSLLASRRAGWWVACGIACGVLWHVAYTLLGAGLLLHRWPWLFGALKWLGAAYLVWLGVRLWRQAAAQPPGSRQPAPAAAAGPRPRAPTPRGYWLLGLGTNALNPKTALFILSLFMQVVQPSTPWGTQLAYGLAIAAAHLVWFALVASFFSAPAWQPRVQALRPWIDKSLGGVLVLLGVLMLGAGMPTLA